MKKSPVVFGAMSALLRSMTLGAQQPPPAPTAAPASIGLAFIEPWRVCLSGAQPDGLTAIERRKSLLRVDQVADRYQSDGVKPRSQPASQPSTAPCQCGSSRASERCSRTSGRRGGHRSYRWRGWQGGRDRCYHRSSCGRSRETPRTTGSRGSTTASGGRAAATGAGIRGRAEGNL